MTNRNVRLQHWIEPVNKHCDALIAPPKPLYTKSRFFEDSSKNSIQTQLSDVANISNNAFQLWQNQACSFQSPKPTPTTHCNPLIHSQTPKQLKYIHQVIPTGSHHHSVPLNQFPTTFSPKSTFNSSPILQDFLQQRHWNLH